VSWNKTKPAHQFVQFTDLNDEGDMGPFQTPSGPLYVNAGIGYFRLNVRFNCRPEITVVEI